ncbi:hypothetical protein BDR03DRAFT_1087318 [Suillus americanus]|nr:hypothetical protein BDR03DRAFT_1087318 [Suillus americanus]
MDDDFDFDRAASAFPDLDLDGHGDVPLPSAPAAASSGFSFDDFGTPLGQTEVKVTGDDEIEKFEDQFPELNIGQSVSSPAHALPTFGAPPPFAPRPQPSAFSSTPILNQQLDEDEPEVIRDEEGDFLESLSSSLTKGTTWERICEIIELQNSQSKTIARAGPGTTDLSRFKEVLLRLKREGTAAPGAAGY